MTDQPRLRAADLLPTATTGLQARPVRAVLSVIGIAVGVAALVAILGITRSSQADLLTRIDRLGTTLLTVTNGQQVDGSEAELPVPATAMVAHTAGVRVAASAAELTSVRIYRTDRVPAYSSGGLSARAADTRLLSALDGHLAHGVFLTPVTSRYPVTVLGHRAAETLGIADLSGTPRVWIGGRWFTVVGILRPVDLAPEIDGSVLVGYPIARQDFSYDGHPSRIYVWTRPDRTDAVADLLARAADPEHPEQVSVVRPSDALAARLVVMSSTTLLYLGLGAVALLAGGVGVANIMVISVLERRGEIGLRRALGATSRHVAVQFLVESILLGAAGGTVGALLGSALTYAVALEHGWQPLVSADALCVAFATALTVGAVAGLYPAARAAGMPPTDALRAA